MEKVYFDLPKEKRREITAATLTQAACQLIAAGKPATKAVEIVAAVYGVILESNNENWNILSKH